MEAFLMEVEKDEIALIYYVARTDFSSPYSSLFRTLGYRS